MSFKGIIITGTSCSGKSSVVEELCKKKELPFQIVPAITTRERRSGDTNFEYCTQNDFIRLSKGKELLVETSYRSKLYGIKDKAYQKVLSSKKIPVLVITPSSASELYSRDSFLSFFIDASDEQLAQRLKKRENRNFSEYEKKQIIEDRKEAYKANYMIKNHLLQSSISLIEWLWEHRNQGGGLSKGIIEKMIDCGLLLEQADKKGVKGASYDLLLGDEYYYDGEIKQLSDAKPFLTIESYDYAIVSCKEKASMPRDIIAKFGLTVGLFCQGIILSNGPQIDPGFKGTLFCLLFNTSNRAVHLKRGKHYATIEFNKLIEPAEPYSGQYQGSEKIIEYIPANALHGAINELKKEIERLKDESRYMQNIYLGVAGLMFAIISILLVLR